MISKTLAAALIGVGCVSAAAGGGYIAMRQNETAAQSVTEQAPSPAVPDSKPVAETEAVISAPAPEAVEPSPPPAAAPPPPPVTRRERVERPAPVRVLRRPSGKSAAAIPVLPASSPTPVAVERAVVEPPVAAPPVEPVAELTAAPEPAPVPLSQYDEVILPATSVIGLQISTAISSERARVEDRVDARVTRDVSTAGRLAIPAGSHVIGSVTLVERGGKVKETARLGVRFHTLVLADGREVPLRTEAILREGESPAAASARKIGGAAIGGAILGALMGGKKGAVVGGATGAAGGTAAVVTGDRKVATLPPGTIVTVKLVSPATIDVERR